MRPQISSRAFDTIRIVIEKADADVAVGAQKRSNAPRYVVVVDRKLALSPGIGARTDSTNSALLG